LALLEEQGFIRTRQPAKRGAAKDYQVNVPEIQQALVGHLTQGSMPTCVTDQFIVGQMTDDEHTYRSNDRRPAGHLTDSPSVKQPLVRRSNDRALKKKSKEFKKESSEEAIFSLSKLEPSSQEGPHQIVPSSPIQVGIVTYCQPPETIDLSELWANNPGLAKAELRFIAPRHRRPEMAVHGFGHWWVGPGLNDFDEFLIKACQKRKQKLEQPDSLGDAKTYINNLLKGGDWANFELRCDEAKDLKDRALAPSPHQSSTASSAPLGALERSEAEQRESALGLARFKVSKGQVEGAEAIARQFGFTSSEIGLVFANKK
jgi:hypothetical protein